MTRYKRFTFLLNSDERKLIAKLAHILQRSQGDAIRFVLRQDLERRGMLANEPAIGKTPESNHQEAHDGS